MPGLETKRILKHQPRRRSGSGLCFVADAGSRRDYKQSCQAICCEYDAMAGRNRYGVRWCCWASLRWPPRWPTGAIAFGSVAVLVIRISVHTSLC